MTCTDPLCHDCNRKALEEAMKQLMAVHDALHRECDGKADLPAEIRDLRHELDAEQAKVAALVEALRLVDTATAPGIGMVSAPQIRAIAHAALALAKGAA
jgi:hypothetical protein